HLSTLFPYTTLFRSTVPPDHPNSARNSSATGSELSRWTESARMGWLESEIQTTRNGSAPPNAPASLAPANPRTRASSRESEWARSEEHTSELQSREK